MKCTSIWLGKNGYYYTYLIDELGERKLVKRRKKEDIEKLVESVKETDVHTVQIRKNKRTTSKKDISPNSNYMELQNIKLKLEKYLNTKSLSTTRLYHIYRGMKERCYCHTFPCYNNYGDRGIKICPEWMDEYFGVWKFMLWSIENGYRDDLTIDRIDVNEDYSPDNCRWANEYEQQNNRINNIRYIFEGEYYTVAEISRMTNVPYLRLYRKIVEKGIDPEEAVEQTRIE